MPATPQIDALPGTTPLGLRVFPKVDDPAASEPMLVRELGAQCFCMLRDRTWAWVMGYDAGRTKAQIIFIRTYDDVAMEGTCPGASTAVRAMPPAAILGKLTAGIQARTDRLAAERAAFAVIRKGARMEFTNSKHGTVVGTVTRVNQKTVNLLTDEGSEWRVSPQSLRLSAAPAPVALPVHPTMARWSLGKVKHGLIGNEGRSWEQPIRLDGKLVGYLRDDASGGDVDIDAKRDVEAQLVADTKAWAIAMGETDPQGEWYSVWAEWETNDRPFGRAYRTLAQRFN